MAASGRVGDDRSEIEALTALHRGRRTEPAGRVSRAAMLLGYREKPSFFAVGRRLGVHHQTVQLRRGERWPMARLRHLMTDRDRAKSRAITPEAKAWLVSLACDKAKEHGYPRMNCGRHGAWPAMARERGLAAGHHGRLARLAQGTVCKLLGQEEIKPHKVRYYLERRDAEFEPKMAEVLCVYREVQVLKKAAAKAGEIEEAGRDRLLRPEAWNPGHRHDGAGFAASARPPCELRAGSPSTNAMARLSLLAGIDLLTGKVHARSSGSATTAAAPAVLRYWPRSAGPGHG